MGFVSNSSSSSFVFVGRQIPLENIAGKDNIWFCGDHLSSGWDMIQLDQKMIKLVLDNKVLFSIKGYVFYDIMYSASTEYLDESEDNRERWSLEIDNAKGSIPEKFKVMEIEVDNHRVFESSDFKYRYVSPDKDCD